MSNYTAGIEDVFIHFDDDDGLYEAGQTLSGKIVVNVESTSMIGGIKLIIQGGPSKFLTRPIVPFVPYI